MHSSPLLLLSNCLPHAAGVCVGGVAAAGALPDNALPVVFVTMEISDTLMQSSTKQIQV